MKWILWILAFLLMMLPLTSQATDPWSTQDVLLEVACQSTLFLDYLQTRQIAKDPTRYYETNPLLGRHPSLVTVSAYFVGVSLAHVGIVHLIPKDYRPYFQAGTILLELAVVRHNYSLGLGFRW